MPTNLEVTDGQLKSTDLGESIQVKLWCVVVTAPAGTNTVFILAKDADGAERQARCHLKLSTYSVTKEVEPLIKAHAVRVLFGIEGWGATKF